MDKKILHFIGIIGLNMGVAILPAQAADQHQTCQTVCDTNVSEQTAVYKFRQYCVGYFNKGTNEHYVKEKIVSWKHNPNCIQTCESEINAVCSQQDNEKQKQCKEWQQICGWK